MAKLRFIAVAVACAALAAIGASAATAATVPLRAAVGALEVAPERNGGYDRDRFGGWIDADGDGCDTRDEVLIAEAVERPETIDDCDLIGGWWVSRYDGIETMAPGQLDVDHLVPLKEAWGSGAHAWTAEARRAFANDLGFPGALVAVSASSNRSKGDRDPAEWLPKLGVCIYVRDYVAVKTKWRLTVDAAERVALLRVADKCDGSRVALLPAPAVLKSKAAAGTATWGRIGVALTLTLDDPVSGAQAASPCATPARARVTAARAVGTRWKTPTGLAVGSTVADVRRLYPDAVPVKAERGLHAAGWRLIQMRSICLGDGCPSEIIVSSLLVAETKGDRVSAIVAVVPKRL